MKKTEIFVTRSSLPALEEFIPYLEKLWKSRFLTNMGEFHEELRGELKEHLKVKEVELFTNGHLALEFLLECFGKEGEIITTPFSFASTTHAIVRKGFTPVFCDIDEEDFTIHPDAIRKKITDKTKAILPVHVYGNLCDVEGLEALSKEYHIPVLYDAAHAFFERFRGRGIGSFGTASMFSFHATKVFHTIEGGAVVSGEENAALFQKLYELKNFGILGQEEVKSAGGNGKMNEFSAAMGLCNLKHLPEYIAGRKRVYELYKEELQGLENLLFPKEQQDLEKNYAYMPVRLLGEGKRDEVFLALEKEGIHARKYFYPCINAYDCYKGRFNEEETPLAKRISKEILTLPIYPELSEQDILRIVKIVKTVMKSIGQNK